MFVHFTKKIEKEVLFELFLFCAGIASIVLLFKNNLLLTLVMIITWGVGLVFWHKKADVIYFITGGIVGPVAEIICIQSGVWQYANPSFLGIPLWLPFAWGLATVLTKRIAETVIKITK